jgi:hypothetical protein
MSRLDDELRNAFRREPPPANFTARVLERTAQQPSPRPRWWQKLATLFEPPKLRWVAIGVTASLLLAIGAAQYSKLRRTAVDENARVAGVQASDEANSPTVTPDRNNQPKDLATLGPKPVQDIKRGATSSRGHRLALARYQKERELRAEGEAAKQKLMLALSIASATLNNAERAIRDEGLTP